jgi:hypothetical protein
MYHHAQLFSIEIGTFCLRVGLKPGSSQSQLPKQLGLQASVTSVQEIQLSDMLSDVSHFV